MVRDCATSNVYSEQLISVVISTTRTMCTPTRMTARKPHFFDMSTVSPSNTIHPLQLRKSLSFLGLLPVFLLLCLLFLGEESGLQVHFFFLLLHKGRFSAHRVKKAQSSFGFIRQRVGPEVWHESDAMFVKSNCMSEVLDVRV